jgi:hypothetical protein
MATQKAAPGDRSYKVLSSFFYNHGVYAVGTVHSFSKLDAAMLLKRGVIEGIN